MACEKSFIQATQKIELAEQSAFSFEITTSGCLHSRVPSLRLNREAQTISIRFRWLSTLTVTATLRPLQFERGIAPGALSRINKGMGSWNETQ